MHPRYRIQLPCGGTASAVIDLAYPHVDQIGGGLWLAGLPWQPVMIGHCADLGDPDSPMLTTGELTEPGGPLLVSCTRCDSEVQFAPGPQFTVIVIGHERGCTESTELAARRPS